jgi:hypothetical protein
VLPKIAKEWKNNVQELVKVERITRRWNTKKKEWIESYECSFYLSTKGFTAEEYGKIIR